MTAYTSAKDSVRYDRTMPSGASPRWKARITNSRSTRLLPTRNTPGGSSHKGTATVRGSKSTVVMVATFLSTNLHRRTLSRPVSIQSGFKEGRNSPTTVWMSPFSTLVYVGYKPWNGIPLAAIFFGSSAGSLVPSGRVPRDALGRLLLVTTGRLTAYRRPSGGGSTHQPGLYPLGTLSRNGVVSATGSG